MNTTVRETYEVLGLDQSEWASPDEHVRACICGLLSQFQPRPMRVERRSDQRYPFPYLLYLTPVDAEGAPALSDTVVVVGKHISEHGIGFYHTRPLPHRRIFVSFEVGDGSSMSFLTNLTWCRFTKQGWYESGGRFVRAVSPPLAVK